MTIGVTPDEKYSHDSAIEYPYTANTDTGWVTRYATPPPCESTSSTSVQSSVGPKDLGACRSRRHSSIESEPQFVCTPLQRPNGEGVHPLPRQRQPSEMGANEINAFLSHLAVDRTVSASTQKPGLGRSPLPLAVAARCWPGPLRGISRKMDPESIVAATRSVPLRGSLKNLRASCSAVPSITWV